MPGRPGKKLWLYSCGLLLSSCAHVTLPDFPAFSIAGDLQAGADYAWTGHDESGSVDMKTIIDILEDGAIIIRHQDFLLYKTAAEQACYQLKGACSQEMRDAIQDFSTRTDGLGAKPSIYLK